MTRLIHGSLTLAWNWSALLEAGQYLLIGCGLVFILGLPVAVLVFLTGRASLRNSPRRRIFCTWLSVSLGYACFECGALLLVAINNWTLSNNLPRQLGSSPGVTRIVAIGGSTMKGEPYDPRISMPEIVGWQLREGFPEAEIVVENFAEGGNTLEQMLRVLASDLKKKPSVLLVYSAHNEFIARFPWFAEYRWNPLRELTDGSPGSRLLQQVANQRQLGEGFDPSDRKLFDVPVCSRQQWQERVEEYGRHLNILVDWCHSEEIPLVLMVPAANLAQMEPNRSVAFPEANDEIQTTLKSLYNQCNTRLAAGEFDQAVETLERALDLVPDFAETHHKMGIAQRLSGNLERARHHFQLAVDYDWFPVRAQTAFLDRIRALADRDGVTVLDCPVLLEQHSKSGLLDREMFHDQHHLTLQGMLVLSHHAAKVVGEILGIPSPQDVASAEACKRQFGFTREDEIRMLSERGGLYRFAARFRFDPRYRLSEASSYFEQAERLRSEIQNPVAPDPFLSETRAQ